MNGLGWLLFIKNADVIYALKWLELNPELPT